eukprot:7342010-Prymnesium_polylepis.2
MVPAVMALMTLMMQILPPEATASQTVASEVVATPTVMFVAAATAQQLPPEVLAPTCNAAKDEDGRGCDGGSGKPAAGGDAAIALPTLGSAWAGKLQQPSERHPEDKAQCSASHFSHHAVLTIAVTILVSVCRRALGLLVRRKPAGPASRCGSAAFRVAHLRARFHTWLRAS